MRKIVSHSRMYLERASESERKITTTRMDGWMDGRQNSSRKAESREQHQPKRHGNKPCWNKEITFFVCYMLTSSYCVSLAFFFAPLIPREMMMMMMGCRKEHPRIASVIAICLFPEIFFNIKRSTLFTFKHEERRREAWRKFQIQPKNQQIGKFSFSAL